MKMNNMNRRIFLIFDLNLFIIPIYVYLNTLYIALNSRNGRRRMLYVLIKSKR